MEEAIRLALRQVPPSGAIGEAAGERLVLGDSFRAFINDFLQTKFDAHVHLVPSGQATTPPQAAFVGAQMPEELLSRVAKVR